MPLEKVAGTLTTALISEKIQILEESLRKDFDIRKPRIAVLGLNPHAGDEGLIGDEEINIIKPAIEDSWKEVLHDEFNKSYFMDLKAFLVEEKKKFRVFPPGPLIFNAFNHTPFDRVKVVFIGQDPYHGTGQAHGLCFSVPRGISSPPSLVNIFKEINRTQSINIQCNSLSQRYTGL
ncbi:MAG: hypothetical protein HGB17_09775 [Syntrophobacteraceae bacterium]|nr:hypothetical protein [Syntrophobacteraceae bacterium]